MANRRPDSSSPTELKPGDTEYELGVPIPGQILAKEDWVQTALKRLPPPGPLDLPGLFGRSAPISVELGCGNGRYTISSAVRRNDWNHLAIDVLPAVVRYATRRANQRGLSNVRVAVCDGWRFLAEYLGNDSVDEFHIYHPQPYADPKHAAKRMLTPDFVAMLFQRLAVGGQVYLQTDRQPYWLYIESAFRELFQFEVVDGPWPEDPLGRSRREFLANQQGLKIYRAVAKKTQVTDWPALQSIVEKLPQPNFIIQRPRRRGPRRR